MRPLTIITGIVLGSAFAISFGLAVVSLIFLILGDDNPRVESESRGLASSLAIFLVLTAIAAVSFFSLLKKHRLWYVFQLLLWAGVVCIGLWYRPA